MQMTPPPFPQNSLRTQLRANRVGIPEAKVVPQNNTRQGNLETTPSGTYRVKWKGKISDQIPFTKVLEKVNSGELGMLTQIEVNSNWLTLREFLAQHERSEKERLKNEAEEMRRAEEEARRAEEEARRAEEQARRVEEARSAPAGAVKFCTNCGNQVMPTAAICLKCGSPIGNFFSNSTELKSRKSRVAYVLLGLILGGAGFHNFYAGYVGRGIAQLILTSAAIFTPGSDGLILAVVSWVWVIIEVIAVTTDGDGRRFS